MALLNSLKLIPYEPTKRNNFFLKRRRKLIAKIDEQILLQLIPTTNLRRQSGYIMTTVLNANLKYQNV